MLRNVLASLVVNLVVWETAQAAIVTPSTLNGNTYQDFSAPGLLSVDPDFSVFDSMSLSIEIEAGDGPLLAFNSVVDLLDGRDPGAFTLELSGAFWDTVGTVDAGIGQLILVRNEPTVIRFSTLGENDGFVLGNPFALVGETDWVIDVSSLPVGSSFTLTMTPAPEPSTALLGVLGAIALFRMRRGKRRD
jgi:hypothetical protein